MFPVFVFLAFVGISAFERGLMGYHDRRIAKERKQMERQRKNQRELSALDDDLNDSDFSDYSSDSDWSPEDYSLKPSITRKRTPRGSRTQVHFSPGPGRTNASIRPVNAPSNCCHNAKYAASDARPDSWSGTHWDSFIDDWTDNEPMVNPWGNVPSHAMQASSLYNHAPYVQASHAHKPEGERRRIFS
ncbi:MAG: hypothetical protein M1821_003790 [Bathelium mastoideum]|nr:MAG: hypothetical protein M1821_003790 [Bathelium mastoideum]KAI9690869.1 MAG: hypothetical protein M1822_008488 [Bathelium mastoideum]